MTEQEEQFDEYTPGWSGTLEAAIHAAMASVPVGEPREIETIHVRKKGNPIHEYKVDLRQ